MIEVVGTILILYLIYKLVFDFIVPVSKTASQFKDQVNEIKRQQEEKMRRQLSGFSQPQPPKTAQKEKGNTTTTTDGEYIDYEEIK